MKRVLFALVLTSRALTSTAYGEDAVPMPARFTVQESTIGQAVTVSDRTQYNPKVGKTPGVRVLADFRGLSLYTFDGGDCTGSCLQEWTPVAAPLMAVAKGDWSILRRADGTPQWAYKGRALYTFARDARAGDANGEGLGGRWHAARP